MNTTQDLRRLVERTAAEAKAPGMAVAVAGPEGVLAVDAVGYADLSARRPAAVDDQYPWFSMTKIATATAAMRLHAEGLLDLDAPVGSYLPWYRPPARLGHPTTRHLLTHTAGLGNPLPIRWVRPAEQPPDPSFSSRVLARHGAPRRRVGGRASYSNIGYLLAAEVIESVTGASVEDSVRDAVLRPLGMGSTGYCYDPRLPHSVGHVRVPAPLVPVLRRALPTGIADAHIDGYVSLRPFLVEGAGYGGLVGTVRDAARLAAVHAAGEGDDHPLLVQHDIEEMRTIRAAGKRFDHGIGWFRRPRDATRAPAFVEHYGTGGGFHNAMRIYPGRGLAMVAMANTTSGWDVDALFTRIEELAWS